MEDEEVDVAADADEEGEGPTNEPTIPGLSVVDVENDISGRSARRSPTCHISPTAAGYPIVTPMAPGSWPDAVGAAHSTNVAAQNESNLKLIW